MADKIRVSKSGSGAPTSITPTFIGQIYIDETSGTRYEATALTEGSWVDKLSLKENTANKKTTITSSDTDYPTCKAVETGLAAKQASLGYTAEDAANKVTSFQETPDDTHYPSEKLVKDSLDAKQDTLNINSLTEKTTPVDDDVLLIEDSEASYAKKKVKKSNLGGGAVYGISGTTEQFASDAEVSGTTVSKQFTLLVPGLVTIQYDVSKSYGDGTDTLSITIFDCVATSKTIAISTSYGTKSEQIFLVPGKYTMTISNSNGRTVYLKNLKLKFDVSPIGTTYAI